MLKWLTNGKFKGWVEATAFKVTGETDGSKFLKGDGTLDDTIYETPVGAQTKADQAESDVIAWVKQQGLGGYNTDGALLSNPDLNTVTDSSQMIFVQGESMTNKPNDLVRRGWLIVQAYSSNLLAQIFITLDDDPETGATDKYDNIYFRNRSFGSWHPWKQITDKEYVDSLIAAVKEAQGEANSPVPVYRTTGGQLVSEPVRLDNVGTVIINVGNLNSGGYIFRKDFCLISYDGTNVIIRSNKTTINDIVSPVVSTKNSTIAVSVNKNVVKAFIDGELIGEEIGDNESWADGSSAQLTSSGNVCDYYTAQLYNLALSEAQIKQLSNNPGNIPYELTGVDGAELVQNGGFDTDISNVSLNSSDEISSISHNTTNPISGTGSLNVKVDTIGSSDVHPVVSIDNDILDKSKQYLVTATFRVNSGTVYLRRVSDGGGVTYVNTSYAVGTHKFSFLTKDRNSSNFALYFKGNIEPFDLDIDDFSIKQVGNIAKYGDAKSLDIWYDESGNDLHLTNYGAELFNERKHFTAGYGHFSQIDLGEPKHDAMISVNVPTETTPKDIINATYGSWDPSIRVTHDGQLNTLSHITSRHNVYAQDGAIYMGTAWGQNASIYSGANDLWLTTGGKDIYFRSANDVGNAVMKADGRFGLGTTTPTEKLHVAGKGLFEDNMSIIGVSNSLFYGLSIKAGAGNLWEVGTERNDSESGTTIVSPLKIKNGGNTLLTTTQEGKFGIGTISPTEKLHVEGNALINGNLQLVDGSTIGVLGGETLNLQKLTGSGVSYLNLGLSTTAKKPFTIDNGSGLIFGSSQGSNAILANTASTFIFGKTGSGLSNYEFSSSVETVTFLNTGNVGIGTTTPTEKLHVAGNTKIEGLTNAAGIYSIENGVITVEKPKGATGHVTGFGTIGAIKITLPVLWTNTRMQFKVSIYNYREEGNTEIVVSGTNYTGTSNWIYQDVYTIGSMESSDLPVRFGNDGTNACVWIGDLDTVWNYANIKVTDFRGENQGTTSQWAENWSISHVTTFDTVQGNVFEGNFSYADFNKLKNLTASSTQLVLGDGSGITDYRDFGLGVELTNYGDDLNLVDKTSFKYVSGGGMVNSPGNGFLLTQRLDSNYGSQLWASSTQTNPILKFRSETAGVWSGWKELYHTGNDTNLFFKDGSRAMTGDLSLPRESKIEFFLNYIESQLNDKLYIKGHNGIEFNTYDGGEGVLKTPLKLDYDYIRVNGETRSDSFVNVNSSDSYMLLGGGGTKALSDFTGLYGVVDDLNRTDLSFGLHKIASGTTLNGPNGSSGTVQIEESGAPGYITQRVQSINGDENTVRYYVRHYSANSSAWGEWKEVYHTGNLTPLTIGTTSTTAAAGNHSHAWSEITSKSSVVYGSDTTASNDVTGAGSGVSKSGFYRDNNTENGFTIFNYTSHSSSGNYGFSVGIGPNYNNDSDLKYRVKYNGTWGGLFTLATTNTTQTITGAKTFSQDIKLNKDTALFEIGGNGTSINGPHGFKFGRRTDMSGDGMYMFYRTSPETLYFENDAGDKLFEISLTGVSKSKGNFTAPKVFSTSGSTSLRSTKKNIVPTKTSGLSLINQYKFYDFDYKKEEMGTNMFGLMLDEAPEKIVMDEEHLNINNVIFVNAKAIQELNDKVEKQQKQIDQLLKLLEDGKRN